MQTKVLVHIDMFKQNNNNKNKIQKARGFSWHYGNCGCEKKLNLASNLQY